jgi:hypothetical protein
MTAMLLASATPAWSDDAREDRIVLHISKLSDGKTEKIVSFSQPGTDKSMALNIPNGAEIVSASMNVSGLPYTNGGDDCPENVTVDVGNDGTPEWAFRGKGYGQMGHQTLFSDGTKYVNVGLPQNGGTNSSATVRLPKNAEVTNANMNVSGGGNFIVIYADNDPVYVNDVLTKLRAFTNDLSTVDAFNAGTGTPSLDLLKSYSGCLVYSNSYASIKGYTSFQDRVALGNVLADYVDYGSGVVTAHFCWYSTTGIGGRFNDQGYFLVPTGGNTGWTDKFSIQSVQMPNHPIMNGVTDIHFTAQSLISSPAVTAGVNGGQIVFTWTLGSCAGALVKTMPNGANRVDLYYIPWSDSVPYRADYGQGYTGNGDVLMKNSLVWTGGAGSGNFSLDVGNDGHIDWANPHMSKPETTPDFSSQLNNYLATAQPSGTDSYGNEYVDVPIAVISNSSGRLSLRNLNINYTSTSTVGINPDTGNLAGALNALVPKKYDMKSTNITVAIFSNHTGKIKISNIKIDFMLAHPPIIQTRTPEESIVFMNENDTQEFRITAWDPYDFPMCATWLVNSKVVLRGYYNMSWFADYEANGSYTVTVQVDNSEGKTTTSWTLTVMNVNRKPVIDSFEPEKKFVMDENSSATFTVTASDPDKDSVTYSWYVDGKRVTGEEPSYEYKTTYFSAGKHEIRVAVFDPASASTVMSWDVTVNSVNAPPEITDWSPPLDEVAMNENSTKKFSVTDLAIDGDKHIISWFVDGSGTGATGRSYEYSAGYDSAGRHEVTAVVSDGKLSTNRTWYVTVADVNRPPVAIISAPAAGTEFMVGDEITLDGTQSSDPDGDQLVMTWSEGPKTLGTGATLQVMLSKGKHSIALKADDGRENGNASATLQITVKYIDFSGKLTVDTETPVEDKNIKLTAVLSNRGDGSIEELPVSFSVDGTEVSTTTIESVGPDSDFLLDFQWNAVKGNHKLEVSVNNQNFSKTVTVAKKPAAAVAGGDMLMPLLVIAIVVVIAMAAGAAIYASRKKRTASEPEAEETEIPEEPEKAVPYKPVKKAPAAPAARPRPVAAPAAAPAITQTPAASDEAKANEAIDNTEKLLQDAEKAGLDTTKARQSLKVARNFFEMGGYQKVMAYCKTAEDSIG